MTDKDFDTWNGKKKQLHSTEKKRYVHEREIWWCYLGLNVGFEQDGGSEKFLRPVIVMRAFGAHTCVIVPLTTSLKQHTLRISVGEVDGEQAAALLSQIRVVDTKRMLEKMCVLDKSVYEQLRKAVRDLF